MNDQDSMYLSLPLPFQKYFLNKMDESNQIKEENTNKKSLDFQNTYLLDSAFFIEQAQGHEEALEYESAFESYKCAIGILSKGAELESDLIKKEAIRRKILNYLQKAESLYNLCIHKPNSFKLSWSLMSSKVKHKKYTTDSMLFGSAQELSNFKVIGLIGKLQQVQDVLTGIIYIMKVVYKLQYLTHPLFPQNIPNMAQIYRIYETDYAHFLLLQYIDGVELLDYAFSSYPKPDPYCCVNCNFGSNFNLCQYFKQEMSLNKEKKETKNAKNDESENNDTKEKNYSKKNSNSYLRNIFRLNSINDFNFIDAKNHQNHCIDSFKRQQEQNYKLTNDLTNSESNSENDRLNKFKSQIATDNFENEKSNFKKITLSKSLEPEFVSEKFNISYLLSRTKTLLQNVDQTLQIASKNNFFNKSNISKSFTSAIISDDEQNKRIKKKISKFGLTESNVNEKNAKKWLWQLIIALENLHQNHIIIGDLKPKNLLLDLNENNLLLTYKFSLDFEFTLNEDFISNWSIHCAPEIFRHPSKIDQCADWWSVGVIAYELITRQELKICSLSTIKNNNIYFPDFVSIEAKDLIRKLLQINPSERLGKHGSFELKMHPFFSDLEVYNF